MSQHVAAVRVLEGGEHVGAWPSVKLDSGEPGLYSEEPRLTFFHSSRQEPGQGGRAGKALPPEASHLVSTEGT